MVQMPGGIPVATLSIGRAGAINSALYAAAILALKYPDVREKLLAYRAKQTATILANDDPRA
jgi:5-(carboxyamino)imidazole ribonucleotide mutase